MIRAKSRSAFVAALAFVLCTGASAQAPDLVFCVTEGVTYQATPKEVRDKFEPIADALARGIKRSVRVQLIPSYNDLRTALKAQQCDLSFIHPAHVAFEAIRAGNYKASAWTQGYLEYSVRILGPANGTLKSFADMKGHSLVTPEKDSITWAMVNAMLRSDKLGPADVKVMNTRYQDAVPFYIEKSFAEYGATAANAVVKQWTDAGGKVFAKSQGVPIKQIIVSNKVGPADQERVRDILLGLAQNEAGLKVLAPSGYKGFVAPNPEVEKTSMAWLGI